MMSHTRLRTPIALTAAIAATACGSAPTPATRGQTPRSEVAPPALALVEDAGSAPTPSEAVASTGFAVVVEGACPELGFTAFENVAFVHYGHLHVDSNEAVSRIVFARESPSGGVVEDSTLAADLAIDAGMWEAAFLSFSGTWPERAVATIDVRNEMGSHLEARFAWKSKRWEKLPDPTEHVEEIRREWMNGSTLWLRHREMYPAFKVTPNNAPTPNFSALRTSRKGKTQDCMFDYGNMLTRPSTGEVFLAGRYCSIFPEHLDAYMRTSVGRGRAALARWVPGTNAKLEPIPAVSTPDTLTLVGLVEDPPTSLFLFGNYSVADQRRDYVARFDGTKWSRIDVPYTDYGRELHVDRNGTLWVAAGTKLYQRTRDGAWKTEPLEQVDSLAWAADAPLWAVANHELWRRDAAGEWTRAKLPSPAFSSTETFIPERVRIVRGEAWVEARYKESRTEWSQPEERMAVLRQSTGLPHAHVSRCESAPIGDKSFVNDWPPAGTDACATPFALLARGTASATQREEYPKTRAALRGQAAATGAQFAEVVIDGRKLFGARVNNVAQGRKLVELVGKGVPGTRPEFLCATPETTRAFPGDWAAGTVMRQK